MSKALLAPVLLPVASPALLANGPVLHAPEDCLHYPLLQHAERADWALWLQAHGVEPDPRSRRGQSFDEDLLLLRAAASGQGIALVRAQLADAGFFRRMDRRATCRRVALNRVPAYSSTSISPVGNATQA